MQNLKLFQLDYWTTLLKIDFNGIEEANLTILDYNEVLIKSEISADDKKAIQN